MHAESVLTLSDLLQRVLSHQDDTALLKAYIVEWRKFFTQCDILPKPFCKLEITLLGNQGSNKKSSVEDSIVRKVAFSFSVFWPYTLHQSILSFKWQYMCNTSILIICFLICLLKLMLDTWNESIFCNIKNRLQDSAMKLVHAERLGEAFDSQLVIGVRESYGKAFIILSHSDSVQMDPSWWTLLSSALSQWICVPTLMISSRSIERILRRHIWIPQRGSTRHKHLPICNRTVFRTIWNMWVYFQTAALPKFGKSESH